MATDLEILERLEKEIGHVLAQREATDTKVNALEKSYLLNSHGKVISLYLNDIGLSEIPSLIFLFRDLETLFLVRNGYVEFPVEITKFHRLKRLSLAFNNISDLPQEILKFASLEELDLWGNKFSKLPEFMLELPKLRILSLKENPLEIPPLEIANQGISAIREYFKSLKEGEELPLNELKVLLVGDGGAGKTSLVKQLLGMRFNKNESQTHGINIRDWKIQEDGKNINVHFWDFGGQEIMHATHQFFLSKRSLYILVLDGRKEEDAEYWLKHIESFGGDSPILIVLNKMDENPGFEVNRRFLQEKYKGIKDFHRISCKKATGIDEFVEKLSEELAKVEILETTWAKSWFSVKTRLESMTDNFISYKEYIGICEEENITKKVAQDTLVDFLNDLGVILHFKDFKLLDTHVLEPKWVTQAVYKIINSERLAKDKGVLKLDSLDQILKKKRKADFYYPTDRYPYIIELMKKFELCYEINEQTVLIPDLLEVAEPEIDFDYGDCLRFLIEYDFLPKSVMPRFIVKMHKDIKGQLRWRTGVVLEDKAFNSTAVIKADQRDKRIYIYVNGVLRRDYFSVLRHAFLSINNSFEKLQFVEKVPMPDEPSVTVSYQHLTRLEKMGVEKYIPDGSENEYKVKDLLGTIYVEKKNEEEILRLLRKIRTQTDDQKSLLKKANEIVQLQPNFFGMGVNLNALIKKLFSKKKR